jgi:hypothetical protein
MLCDGAWGVKVFAICHTVSNSKLALFHATEVAPGRLKPQNPPARVKNSVRVGELGGGTP